MIKIFYQAAADVNCCISNLRGQGSAGGWKLRLAHRLGLQGILCSRFAQTGSIATGTSLAIPIDKLACQSPSLTRRPQTTKFFFGINSHILKPSNYTKVDGSAMPNRHAVEVFSQFNPYRTSTYVAGHRTNVLNEAYSSLSTPGSVNDLHPGGRYPVSRRQAVRVIAASGGKRCTPMEAPRQYLLPRFPQAPILSLVDFANANLSLRSEAAYKDVGNSHASIFVPGNSIYGRHGYVTQRVTTTSDNAWLINDAIFDRYYLSGIAPEFVIGTEG